MAELYRVREITAATKVYGILGADVTLEPLAGDPQPRLRRAGPRRGLRAAPGRGPRAVRGRPARARALGLQRHSALQGRRSCRGSTSVDGTATLAGSVNTVLVRDGRLDGSSTDGLGFSSPSARRSGSRIGGIVILGAGGAARAAALALVQEGARVTVLARNPQQAAAVAKDDGLRRRRPGAARRPRLGRADQRDTDGLDVQPGQSPVPAALLRPGTVVFDMVYEPLETRLLRDADKAGCVTIDGLQMLLAQAAGPVRGLDRPRGARGGDEVGGAGGHQQRIAARSAPREPLLAPGAVRRHRSRGPEAPAYRRVLVVGVRRPRLRARRDDGAGRGGRADRRGPRLRRGRRTCSGSPCSTEEDARARPAQGRGRGGASAPPQLGRRRARARGRRLRRKRGCPRPPRRSRPRRHRQLRDAVPHERRVRASPGSPGSTERASAPYGLALLVRPGVSPCLRCVLGDRPAPGASRHLRHGRRRGPDRPRDRRDPGGGRRSRSCPGGSESLLRGPRDRGPVGRGRST